MLAVSSEAQADTLSHQRAWAERVAADRGWTLERVLGDDPRDGVGSGKDGPRAIVRRTIAELRKLAPDARPAWLLITRADRLGRGKIQEALFVQDEIINELGVRILTRDDGEIKLDSPEGEFIAAFRGYYARKDNAVRSDKARAKYAERRAAGKPVANLRAYGLVLDADGRDVVVPEEAEIVRMAFVLRLEGHGYQNIATRIAAVAPPRFRRRGGTRSIAWSVQAVSRMLSTRAYSGTIVDELTWRRAQQIRDQRATSLPSRARKYPWPLAGAIRCTCGHGLVGITGGSHRKTRIRYRYYVCRKRDRHGGRPVHHPAEALEAQFVVLLARLAASPAAVADARRAIAPPNPGLLRSTLRQARSALTAVEQRRSTVWDLAERGQIRAEDVQQRLDTLAADRQEVEDRIAELEQQIAIAESAQRELHDVLETVHLAANTWSIAATDEDRRLIARAFATAVGGLAVGPDHTLILRQAA